jgi:hypothetical protein
MLARSRHAPLMAPLLLALFAVTPAAAAVDYSLLPIGSAPVQAGLYDVKAADLDGDGFVEVVAGIADQHKITVLKSHLDHTGGGSLIGPAVDYPVGNVAALDLADFTGDGRPDVVTADWAEGQVTFRANLGDGTFGPATLLPMGSPGSNVRDVAGADLDGDGVLDVAAAIYQGQVVMRRGLGGGAFGAPQTLTAPGQLKGIDAGDLDHDGKVDLVVVDLAGRRLVPYYNQGGFVFTAGTPRTVGAPPLNLPSDVKLADLDGDGWLDAAVSNEDGTVSTLHNAAGVLQNQVSYAIGHLAQSVDVADFDLDGLPDLLVSIYTECTVTVLPGVGGGSFGPGVTVWTAVISPRSACAADWDGDGRPDVMAGNFGSGTVIYIRNAKAPRIDYRYTAIDFGTGFSGDVEHFVLALGNIGGTTLTVTPTIDNPQFALAGGNGAIILGSPGNVGLDVVYQRSQVGTADGTLTLTSNDPLEPTVQIALHGATTPPPIADFSAPAPVSLTAGAQGTGTVRLRNFGPVPLVVTVANDFRDYAEASALDVGPTASPFLRADASAATWDVAFDGTLGTGTLDAYKDGMKLTGFAPQPGGFLGVSGRELRLGPVAAGPLQVTRKVYVSPTLGYARYVDVAENPGGQAQTWSYELRDNLGFAQTAPAQTSSGDVAFTTADDWIVVPPDDVPGRRAVGRVVATANAALRPTAALYGQTVVPNTFTGTRYSVEVPPHGRAAIVQWTIQGVDAADAAATAAALRLSPAEAYEHMDAVDRAALVNADPVPAILAVGQAQESIPAGDSLDVAVTFRAGLATHAAEITALLHLTTNDPAHPALDVPLTLEVTGGAVVGTEPVPSAGAVLALAGFRPNPARTGDAARIAFRLVDAQPATIALYDVRGRLLSRRALDHPAPGPGSIALTNALPPGVVWLRLEQGGRSVTSKGIVLP